MSISRGMQELSLDQAPPLAIPMSFFVTAPLFIVAAGLVILLEGSAIFQSPLLPSTIGLAHLGTLGFLGMVMMGALYQMTPVVAGAAVPCIRLAHGVHLVMLLGITALGLWSQNLLHSSSASLAFGSIAVGLLVFGVSVGWALARSQTKGATVWGMRLAVASLLLAMAIGFWMSRGWSGAGFPGDRSFFIQSHFSIAILGWVGGLITAIAWQILPMFYMTSEFPSRKPWAVFWLIGASVIGLLVVLALGKSGTLEAAPGAYAFMCAAPGALAVWVLHPFWALSAIAKRRRKRTDVSLRFWRVGMLLGPLVITSAAAAFLVSDTIWGPRFDLLFGWLAIFGWAGLVVHGMLTRIGPFLIWFHRLSPLVGLVAVPAMGRLIPEWLLRAGFRTHVVALTMGTAAILTGSDWLARLAGLTLALCGLAVAGYFVKLIGYRAPEQPEAATAPTSGA